MVLLSGGYCIERHLMHRGNVRKVNSDKSLSTSTHQRVVQTDIGFYLRFAMAEFDDWNLGRGNGRYAVYILVRFQFLRHLLDNIDAIQLLGVGDPFQGHTDVKVTFLEAELVTGRSEHTQITV